MIQAIKHFYDRLKYLLKAKSMKAMFHRPSRAKLHTLLYFRKESYNRSKRFHCSRKVYIRKSLNAFLIICFFLLLPYILLYFQPFSSLSFHSVLFQQFPPLFFDEFRFLINRNWSLFFFFVCLFAILFLAIFLTFLVFGFTPLLFFLTALYLLLSLVFLLFPFSLLFTVIPFFIFSFTPSFSSWLLSIFFSFDSSSLSF